MKSSCYEYPCIKQRFFRLMCLLLWCAGPLLAQAQEAETYHPNVKEIIVICKTHFDIGYPHRVKDIVNF